MRSERLFLSNHPLAPRMLGALVKVRSQDPETRFVVDSSLAVPLNMIGFKTIAVDVTDKYHWALTKGARFRKRMIEKLDWLNKQIGLTVRPITNDHVVDEIVMNLSIGKSIFIAPAGISGRDAPWRSGVGRAVKKVNPNTPVSFVFIPAGLKRTQIAEAITVGSILPNDKFLKPNEIAQLLQKQYNQIFNDAHNYI